MVSAMGRDPVDRAALERQGSDDRRPVLEPLRNDQAAVRQQAVEAKRDAHAAGEVVQHEGDQHGLPTEEHRQKGGARSEVDEAERDAGRPLGFRLRQTGLAQVQRGGNFLGHSA
jgi:hypothetical protein